MDEKTLKESLQFLSDQSLRNSIKIEDLRESIKKTKSDIKSINLLTNVIVIVILLIVISLLMI